MDKLKKIAERLVDSVEQNSIQFMYEDFTKLMSKQDYYFQNSLGAENSLKVFFHIYSLKTTESFNLSDLILENLYFFELCKSTGQNKEEDCEYCSGYGSLECSTCYSSGEIDCGNCDGRGNEDCGVCSGTGTIDDDVECSNCEGSGEVECDYCNGSGKEECPTCLGDGRETCEDCDGQGSITLDEIEVEFNRYCYWDNEFKEILKKHNEDHEFFSELNPESYIDKSLWLCNTIDYSENDMEPNEWYCSMVSDEFHDEFQKVYFLRQSSSKLGLCFEGETYYAEEI